MNLFQLDGQLYHETAPGIRERIAVDELGAPLIGIVHSDDVSAWRDDGRIVLRVGGAIVSFTANKAIEILDALAKEIPDAKAAEVIERVQVAEEQAAREIEERKEALQATLDEKRAELEAMLDEIGKGRDRENSDLPK